MRDVMMNMVNVGQFCRNDRLKKLYAKAMSSIEELTAAFNTDLGIDSCKVCDDKK